LTERRLRRPAAAQHYRLAANVSSARAGRREKSLSGPGFAPKLRALGERRDGRCLLFGRSPLPPGRGPLYL